MGQNNNRLQYFTIICNTKEQTKMLNLLQEYHAHSISIKYGQGSARRGILAQAFGFETEEKKAVITCLLTTEYALALCDTLKREYHFHKENTGVAFSVAVEGLLF